MYLSYHNTIHFYLSQPILSFNQLCVLCRAIKHFVTTCTVTESFRINPNVTRADSLENDLALSLTDYCLHAPLLPGHYGCVEALVTWGADVDMHIPHLGTALYTACVCQELECARKLLREGQLAALCGSLHMHMSCMNILTQKHKVI